MAIDRKTVEHIAKLARLELSDPELDRLREQLSSILEYAARINELDLADVEPLAHVGDFGNVMRPDVAAPSQPVEATLANAPETSAQYFSVPKIIE
jgi:aspartyl-tRNA(Asn)/glutamyl-tRNA(Gln) amidotransferase subunit C